MGFDSKSIQSKSYWILGKFHPRPYCWMKFHQIRKKPMTLNFLETMDSNFVELIGEYSSLELVLNQILNNSP